MENFKRQFNSNIRYYHNLGFTFYHLERYDESIDILKKSIEIDSKFEYAHCKLALVLIKQRKYKEAEKVMEKVFSNHQINKKEFTYYTMGVLLFKQAHYSSSILHLSTSLQLSFDPYDGEYNSKRYYFITRSMIKNGIKTEEEKEEIKKKLTETITANKQWSKLYYRRAQYYLSLSKEEGDNILSDLQSSLHYNSFSHPSYQLSTKKLNLIRNSIQGKIHPLFYNLFDTIALKE